MPKIKKDSLPQFGNRMWAIRKELRLSQREMAQSLGVTNGYISEVENGHASPGYEFYRVLFSTFPVNPDYLFLGEGEMFRGGSASTTPKLTARDIIEMGEVDALDELVEMLEFSAVFRHKLYGFASDYILANQASLLITLEAKEKISKSKKNKMEKSTPKVPHPPLK